ncbi:uncharacterized protein L201_004384 [Kwoniella dendrophila CBS 6074]|uniref:Scytalone dehydratase-like protein Arp1 N-terminal domain-containing protein n=1 Tax=Kwoniella dendrophila CBS 6074 TaxID=1295534 RepID=A0AAX4JY25_9TREE
MPDADIKPEPNFFYKLGDIEYFSPIQKSSFDLPITFESKIGYQPITIINVCDDLNEKTITASTIEKIIKNYLQNDDVLTCQWFGTIILRIRSTSGTHIEIQRSALNWITNHMKTKLVILDEKLKIQEDISIPNLEIVT